MTDNKTCTTCKQTKPHSEFSKMAKAKDGHQSRCKLCDRAYYIANLEHKKAKSQQWYWENKERKQAYDIEYHQKNREKRLQYHEEWRAANKDHVRAAQAAYKSNNRGIYNAQEAKRRSAKLQATPAWANLAKIKEIYAAAAEESKRLGVPMHVDHIVPLQGELVCGLHTEQNLQILTANENCSKSNTFKVA